MKTILTTLKPLLLILCFAMNAHSTPEKTVFDFQSPTNAAWQIVNNDVMGGLSTSSFRINNGVAVFRGAVSLANNGGFATVRSLPARHDLGKADSFVIHVHGDGRRYKFSAHGSELR